MDTQAADAIGSRKLRADAERNRLRIIDAARELFAERGLEVSLDDVAERAGVGVGTVYRRFTNRDELIVGVLAEHLTQVAERTRLALQDPDAWQAVVDVLTLVGTSMATDRGLAALIMRIDHEHPDIKSAKSILTGQLTQLYERAMEAGVLRPDLAPSDFFGILTMLAALADVTQPTVPDAWRRFLELILDGVRATGRTTLSVPALTDDQILEIQCARRDAHR
ncbi:TetR/AcrR family transcriptional regulator [Gordonia sp. DT218]|uniref:TetR/AcrR family transcriptional regulator n=1 Tax=unclassified Gordonia (in: high G+C Gram-positive bacteria) TaxID=2657482 RepID=UPI003CF95E4F